ncbi:MAG: glycosyltransferase [bacterium]|nr:glycosyltransferase [bacterium]
MSEHDAFSPYVADPRSMDALRCAADMPTSRASNGLPTLSYSGVRLHSAVDPQAEAQLILEDTIRELSALLARSAGAIACVVAGPGLGYVVSALHLWAMESGAAPRMRILCVEADAEVARKALQLRVWENAIVPVTWFVGQEAWSEIKALLGNSPFVCVTATAGYRLRKSLYDEMIAALRPYPLADRRLKILIPTPLYGGSYPIALHCAEALRTLGHDVDVLDFSAWYSLYATIDETTHDARHRRTLQGLLTTFLGEMVAARAIERRANLVWAVAQSPLTPTALEELRREQIHSAFWFVEDYHVFDYWRHLARHFDAIFTIQRGRLHEELHAVGAANVAYLPCAANPAVHRPMELAEAERLRWGADVSFVGAGYRNRQNLFARLRLPGLKIWGSDWPAECAAAQYLQDNGRRVTADETALIYNATKVNLNLHSSQRHSGVNPEGDFVNPRTFEIAACGGFQVTDARSEMAELFGAREMALFRNTEEIPALVEYYLRHEDERGAMANRARERVLREHTYEHRMSSALEFLGRKIPHLFADKGSNYVSSLKQAAEGDAELEAFLSGFRDDQNITLDDIVSRIELGKGALTRAEGLFLLMKEFRDWGREKGVIQ